MGVPSPVIADCVGQPLRCARQGQVALDPHGWSLGTTQTSGEREWSIAHNDFLDAIFQELSRAQVPVTMEPRGLFHSIVPPSILYQDLADDEPEPQPGQRRHRGRRRRGRPAIIPDLMAEPYSDGGRGARRQVMYDLKAIHYSESTYPNQALAFLTPRGGGHQRRGFRSAVQRREEAVPAAYRSAAEAVDSRIRREGFPTINGGVVALMGSYLARDAVRGLAFGTFGEGGPNLHALLETVAREQAQQRWRAMGAESYGSAKGYMTTALYRRWGACIARVNARLRMRRLEHVGMRGRNAQAYGGDGRTDHLGSAGLYAEGLRVDVGGGWGDRRG